MHLVAIGLNHKTAPVEVRERFAVAEGDLSHAVEALNACHCVSECCIVSTCNRTELYAVTDTRENEEVLVEFLSRYHSVERSQFEEHLYRYRGHKAVTHLFGVAAGIDSMMLGENQILGQVRNAFCAAGECDATGTVLNTLFQQAIKVGKRARTETAISKGAFSIGYAAVELASSIFGGLGGRTVMILGAGKMSELTARHLSSAGVTDIVVANRTYEKAEQLACDLCGRAVPFESFGQSMADADIVIGSTGSTEPILDRERMEKIMKLRRERPIFMIDIAVPRDFSSNISQIDNVFLYNIDDLQSMVKQSAEGRAAEIEKVHRIISEETQKFNLWIRSLEAVPLIRMIRDKLDEIKDAEWERYGGKLSHLSGDDQSAVQMMMQSLVNKISHTPLIRIKEYAANDESMDKLDTARDLFGIAPEDLARYENANSQTESEG